MTTEGPPEPDQAPAVLVDCHRLDLSRSDSQDLALLDDGERARAARFHFDRDRIRYIAAHAQARRHLAGRLGLAPADLRFATTRHGKPIVAPAPPDPTKHAADHAIGEETLCFNLTHSGAIGYLAIATCSIGIDVELHRPIDDLQPLIDSYCSAGEIAALAALPAEARCVGFLGVWTRKEAALKAWGTGIGAVPLDQLHVGITPAGAARLGQEFLPGLTHEGVDYPALRLASIAGDAEVLSIAAATGRRLVVRMLPAAP